MRKKGWILLLILVCIAFLVSCGKRETQSSQMGDLVHNGIYMDFP